MIEAGDKIRFLYKESTAFNRGDILTVKSVIPDSDGTYSICFTEEAEPGDWVYPDPECFELVEKEVGIKYDSEKLQMSLLPFESLEEVTKVLEYGAKKYSKDNWKFVPDGKARYEDALLRHFSAHKRGEIFDKESGLKHLHHMACNALFLIWFDLKND